MSLTIFSVSDPAYLSHLEALAASVHASYPQAKLHFHLVNTASSIGERLLRFHPATTICYEEKRFDSDAARRAYCANVRARVMHELLKSGVPLVLYLDADSLVRRDLTPFIQELRRHDVAAHWRTEQADDPEGKMPLMAGVVGVHNTPQSRAFAERWKDFVDDHLFDWFSDQVYLAEAYRELKAELRLWGMPARYIDWHFCCNSAIWVGKGQRKYERRLYVLEEKIFREKADGRSTLKLRLAQLFLRVIKPLANVIQNSTSFKAALRRLLPAEAIRRLKRLR